MLPLNTCNIYVNFIYLKIYIYIYLIKRKIRCNILLSLRLIRVHGCVTLNKQSSNLKTMIAHVERLSINTISAIINGLF